MPDPATETKIWQSLLQLFQLANEEQYRISLPGDSSFEDVSQMHVDLGYLLARPQHTGLGLGQKYRRRATLQATVMEPLGSSNVNDVALQRASLLASRMRPASEPRVFRDIRLWVEEDPHVMEGFREGEYWAVPVRVRTVCEA